MPMFEFRCDACGERFEKLIRNTSTPGAIECPKCGSDRCKKTYSVFGMSYTRGESASTCAPSG